MSRETNTQPPARGKKKPREVDAGKIPPRLRRRAVLESFDRLAPGDSMILRFHQHPLPLLFYLSEDRFGQFTGQFLDRGPEYSVLLTRV